MTNVQDRIKRVFEQADFKLFRKLGAPEPALDSIASYGAYKQQRKCYIL